MAVIYFRMCQCKLLSLKTAQICLFKPWNWGFE